MPSRSHLALPASAVCCVIGAVVAAAAISQAGASPLVDGPTTPLVDTFNRPPENPVSQGGRWSASAINGGQRLQVANALLQSTGTTGSAFRVGNQDPDMEAHVSIAVSPQNGNGIVLFVTLQDVGTAAWDGYGLRIYKQIGGYLWQLYKYTNGSGAPIGTQSWNGIPLSGDRILLRRAGSSLQAWHYTSGTWTLRLSASDGSFFGGRIGLQIIDGGYGGVPVLDDFGGTETPPQDPAEPSALPSTPILDDFNRLTEKPLSQAGFWASSDPSGNAANTLDLDSVQGRNTDTLGQVRSYRTADYTGYVEAYFTVASMPGNGLYLELLLNLTDVGSPLWDGYRFIVLDGASDQFIINRVENGQSFNVGTAVNRNIAVGDRLLARRIGPFIEFWHDAGGIGSWTRVRQELDTYVTVGRIGAGMWKKNGAIDDFGGGAVVSDDALLRLYAPELRYDQQETFEAGSPAMMTDNENGVAYSNSLRVPPDNTVIAEAYHADPEKDDLSLGYLGITYPPGGLGDGRLSTIDDDIQAESNVEQDAQLMQSDPAYADKIYGRIVTEGDGSRTLQYWLFYYYSFLPPGLGEHQGDWELVQVELDPLGNPVQAAYAQHGGGQRCPWLFVEQGAVGGPRVYVANGSHASFFTTGWHGVEYVAGDAPPVNPSVVEINPPGPTWLDWRGQWGGDGGSPVGPAYQGEDRVKWLYPRQWSASLGSCLPGYARTSPDRAAGSSGLSVTGAAPVPPAPKITASRIGKRVKIAYRFATWPSALSRRPVMLVTTVLSRDYPKVSAISFRHRIRTRRGSVTQPLGIGRPPFRLVATAFSSQGRRSKAVRVPIRPSS